MDCSRDFEAKSLNKLENLGVATRPNPPVVSSSGAAGAISRIFLDKVLLRFRAFVGGRAVQQVEY